MNTNELALRLQQVDTLKDVPLSQLEWMADKGFIQSFENDEYLYRSGEPVEYFEIVLTGEFKVYLPETAGRRYVGAFGINAISGVLPYSRIENHKPTAFACTPSTVFRLHRDHIAEMIQLNYELTAALVHQMTTRVREFAKQQSQNEKLLALGKMSAGLAHELNNPASAMARSAKELRKHLATVPEKFESVIQIKMSADQIHDMNKIMAAKLAEPKPILSLMEKSSLEDELYDALDDRDVPNVDDLVGPLVEYGFDEELLGQIHELSGEDDFSPVVHWLVSNLVTDAMIDDINDAAERIAGLVGSIKSFSYMDRNNDMQSTNVHEGLQSTLNLLEHRIQKAGHQLLVDFCKDTPTIQGMPGELNQVWMNILSNAVEALGDTKGEIKVKTMPKGDDVFIHITDNGPGIPEDVKNHIFEPFFTTKGIGEGTGMGLDIVKKIIDKHKGIIRVNSKPGETTFEIILPINKR